MANGRIPPYGVTTGPMDEREIELIDYCRVMWRHRWMILVLSVTATVLTGGVVFLGPRYYATSITIVPPLEVLQKESAVGGLGAMGSALLRGVMDTGSISDMYVEILGSREVADSLIDRFDLIKTYKDIRHRTDARAQLKKNTQITTTEEGVVRIAVKDLDRDRVAAMACAYVEELDRQNKRLSAGNATSKRVFLENRLKEIEQKFSRIDAIPAREAQVQELIYELLIRELELAKIEEARNMPTIQVLDEAETPELPVGRGTIRKGVMAGIAAFMFGTFLAFAREYFQGARQIGLARQFERATRRRKVAGNGELHTSAGNGHKQRDVTKEPAEAGELPMQP